MPAGYLFSLFVQLCPIATSAIIANDAVPVGAISLFPVPNTGTAFSNGDVLIVGIDAYDSRRRCSFYRLLLTLTQPGNDASLPTNWAVFGSNNGSAFSMSSYPNQLAQETNISDLVRADDVIQAVRASFIDFTVNVEVDLLRNGEVTTTTSTLNIAQPAAQTVTDAAVTLVTAPSMGYGEINFFGRLANAGIGTVSIPGMVENTDYAVNREHGAVKSLSGDKVATTITYTYSPVVYDLIVMNRKTGALEVVVGENRVRDAAEKRAKPASPYHVPLVYVRKTQNGLNLGKLYLEEAEDRERLAKNREILRPLRALMLRNAAITWLGDGDSITQLGVPNEAYWYVANGPYRDRFRDIYMAGAVGSDILATIPMFTSLELFGADDGAGQVHTKRGLNLEAIEACRAYYGLTNLAYKNLSIGGTTSANSGGSAGRRPGGTHPDRMAARRNVAAKVDVAVFNYGMNQPNRSTTAEEHVSMANDLRTVHPDVSLIFVGQAKPNDLYRSGADWINQNRAIAWAADHVGAAFVDTTPIWGRASGDANILGLPAIDTGGALFINHPGISELSAMAKLLTRVLI